jgi:hypothetical protein
MLNPQDVTGHSATATAQQLPSVFRRMLCGNNYTRSNYLLKDLRRYLLGFFNDEQIQLHT